MVFSKNDKKGISLWKDRVGLVLNQGGPGFSHFAITNLCDAHCQFCSFAAGKLNSKEIRSVSREQGLQTIDILYNNGIRYIIFVGGEPLLHKDILAFVEHAHDKGMVSMICTNGGRLTKEWILDLKKAGLDDIIISIDAPSVEIHENNRKIKGLCERIREANALFSSLKIQSTASVTISKLVSNYDFLPPFLQSLGFRHVTFSYPLDNLDSSYLGFAKSDLVQYTAQELFSIFNKIKELKKSIHVVNNSVSLKEMQRFLLKRRQYFPCLGGYRYFYVDWNLDIYRCHYWKRPMCKIEDFGPEKFIRDHCNLCMIDCYRDPSVLQHIAVSISDAWQAIKKGEWGEAIRHIFKKTNFLSIQAVMEEMRWIIRL